MSSRSAMALRMVAGESPRMWRRATAREPTGSAVCTYSAITAMRTSRLRWSRAKALILSRLHQSAGAIKDCGPGGEAGLQELREEGVGDEEAGLGQPRAVARVGEET